MSQKYLAWNGEEYPWPPPEDWYEASDGRWWAPNSGPGPKVSETPASSEPSSSEAATQISPSEQQPSAGFGADTTSPQPASDFDATQKQPQVDINQNPTPGFQQSQFGGTPNQNPTPGFQQPQFGGTPNQNPTPGFQQPQFGGTPNQNPTPGFQQPQFGGTPNQNPTPGFQQPQFGEAPQAPFGSNPAGSQGFQQPQQPQQFGAGPAPYNSGAQSGGGGSKLPLILAGVVGLVALIGIGIFALTRGGEETAAVSTTTTTELSTTTTVAQTTTTAEPTTTTAPVDPNEALNGFRTYVVGINIVGLTDEDLNQIGDEACTASASASDSTEWETNLTAIVDAITTAQIITPPSVGTPLTEDAIRDIYEGAVTFYCPSDAERLGISI